MRALSVAQREGVRAVSDGRAVNGRTLASLLRHKLVKIDDETLVLTASGRRAYDQIMASGDGPEALKERFKFRAVRR